MTFFMAVPPQVHEISILAMNLTYLYTRPGFGPGSSGLGVLYSIISHQATESQQSH